MLKFLRGVLWLFQGLCLLFIPESRVNDRNHMYIFGLTKTQRPKQKLKIGQNSLFIPELTETINQRSLSG